LTIGLIDPARAEIVVKLVTAFPNDADPGTVLEFEGIADAVSRNPFALTVLSDPSKISGWPAAPPPRKASHK